MGIDIDETFVSQPSATSTPTKKSSAAFEQLSTSGDIKLIVSTQPEIAQRTVSGTVLVKTMDFTAIRLPTTDPKEPPKFRSSETFTSDKLQLQGLPSGTVLAA